MASLLRTEPSPDVSTATRSWSDGWIIIVGVLVGAITLGGVQARATYGAQTSADEPQYLLSAISLAEDLDLDISDELRDERYRSFHETVLDQQTIEPEASGRQVSPHDPLLPLLLALPMAIGGWIGAKFALAAVAVATAAMTAGLAHRRYGVARSTAAIATVSCFAGLPLAGYGTQIYPEMPAAFLTLVIVAGLTASSEDRRSAAVTLVALIALPWLAVKYVPLAAVGGIALLWRMRQRPTWLAWTTLGAAVGAVTYLAAHRWIYGGWTVYAAGDHFVSTGEFSAVGTDVNLLGRSRRLIGLLVDRDFGIAAWSPVWFLLPLAAVKARVDKVATNRPLLWLLGATWLNATFVALTMHGWWVPGRQVVVALPLGVLLIAQWANTSRTRVRLLALLGLVGLCNWTWLAVEAITGRRTLIVDFSETASWPYRALAPLLPDGLAGGAQGDLLLAVWTVALGVVCIAARRIQMPASGHGNHCDSGPKQHPVPARGED